MKPDRINDRLDRIKHLVAGDKPAQTETAAPARYRRMAEALGGELICDRAGAYCLVTTPYRFGHPFGRTRLERWEPERTVSAASFAALDVDGQVPLHRMTFIDTETTGLGGAGAMAFLIGCGSVTPDGIEIRQYVLPDYADEAAMLERVLTEFGDEVTLVSYNGIAFDINLIRDRMIVNRVARDIPQARHIDLLHSARRLFRRRLGDCSLTKIEREIFGFCRTDDIPGYLIPSVYFDWLQTDNTTVLNAVLEHNRLDILTLCFLLLHVDEIFSSEGDRLEHVDDRYSLARVYGRRRQSEKVTAGWSRLEDMAGRPLPPDMLLYHSLAFKRSGDWESALELWMRLAEGEGPESFEACIELAKYFEHTERDLNRALLYSEQGRRAGPPNGRQRELLNHRLNRINRKLAGQSGP